MDENRSLPASCLSLSATICSFSLCSADRPRGCFGRPNAVLCCQPLTVKIRHKALSLREALWRPLKCLSLYFPFRQTNKFPTSVLPLFSTPGMLSSASLRTQSLHEEEDIPFLFKLVLHFTPSLSSPPRRVHSSVPLHQRQKQRFILRQMLSGCW